MAFVKGTKPSIKNSLLLLSTGCPALDFVIGGGMPVGSTMLIEEDLSNVYAAQLLRYFLSEGVVVGNSLLVASDLHSPAQIIASLPTPCDVPTTVTGVESVSEEMKIAWRYENLPKVKTAVDASGKQFGHNFDLSVKLSSSALGDCCIHKFDMCSGSDEPTTSRFLYLLRTSLSTGCHTPKAKGCQLLRIGVENFGSSLWGSPVETLKLLWLLKLTAQAHIAACVVTVPTQLLDTHTLSRYRATADFVIRLESFRDSGNDKHSNPLFSDYHGLLHVEKLPCWNTLDAHVPDANEFGFKLLRKKFTIEKLHLPPELSEISTDKTKRITTGCGTSLGGSSLDF